MVSYLSLSQFEWIDKVSSHWSRDTSAYVISSFLNPSSPPPSPPSIPPHPPSIPLILLLRCGRLRMELEEYVSSLPQEKLPVRWKNERSKISLVQPDGKMHPTRKKPPPTDAVKYLPKNKTAGGCQLSIGMDCDNAHSESRILSL